MSSLIPSLNLFGPSPLSRYPSVTTSLKTLDSLSSENHTSKSIAQLEHVKYEYERNLGEMVKCLGGKDLSAKERQYLGGKTEFYMNRAESLKAIIMAKKDARDVEQTRRRNSDIQRERARKNSLQEETRRRLSDAKDEQRRRGSGSSAGFEPTVVPTNPPRRKSFTDSHVISHRPAFQTGNGGASALQTLGVKQRHPTGRRPSHPPPNSSHASSHPQTISQYHSKADARKKRGSGTRPHAHGRSSASGAASGGKNSEYKEGLEKQIVDELLMTPPTTRWDDIVGLSDAKEALKETVILPTLRPDIFTGLRSPPKGVLLFGPPGTGKTMIARACACESGFSFFAVSASSLTSKWVGEGEKMMQALFKVAETYAPSVVFMDEVDSVLSRRKSTGEHEASRRMKTEFLVQIDGVNSAENDPDRNVLCIACTNLPWELDDAVLRRFARRIYVPLPDQPARLSIIEKLLAKNANNLTANDRKKLVKATVNYSASDITNLCKEASMGPLRQLSMRSLQNIDNASLPPISLKHFEKALASCQPSVSRDLLNQYEAWDRTG
ncbi:hypothetical protein TrST_g6218 [Triparma strigata]|uniref:AAA+ ATPase domain-containing protein n=1 Tax=Triparma strigata TaxID=1606541 RepID=A0A9W7BDZ7_9STRA|nr:hypothetical protein TrST_g6218 [Triparma strigata]